MASHFEHADEVDLDNLLAFASVEFIKGPIAAEISRIIDKDVDARRLTDNRSKSPFDLMRFRNIDAQRLRTVEFNRMDIPNPDFSTDRTNWVAIALPMRIRIRDRKLERVADLKNFRQTGYWNVWLGMTPDDSPLLLRDTGTQEIYALDWQAP